ncbi:hypothetical protein MPNT_140001 [Candidatus Methylacidithermus pantelleriae]|uniref:Uncharacterized protein n=1 Tax=Candidatus Methylacidithermus pantelleriae TaxID=2744239 RepID=A0A8J2BLH3_9BACT|nr:hypothetical protein MPNT_140001 [Candidatus Methylacidithermus pantelleriae]
MSSIPSDLPPAPYRVLNVGNGRPVGVLRLLEILEELTGRSARRVYLPPAPGDVPATWADIEPLERLTGFRPLTSLEEGLQQFVAWYEKEGRYLDIPDSDRSPSCFH